MENLLISWQEFLKGKRKRKDITEFSLRLMDNIFSIHNDLKDKTYRHGPYESFEINDPKTRRIHKAPIRDRLVHHAIHRILYPFFDRKFIYDSYSCRQNKGTHRAMDRFNSFNRKVSHNHTSTAWVLKGDIRKFFANIDHHVLNAILSEYIYDVDVLWLMSEITSSFCTEGKKNIGLPLGNLTSQLLVNIYMNEFDHFVKRVLKIRHYIRYADDFVVVHTDRRYLVSLIPELGKFLEEKLKLSLHPDKVFIKTIYSGVDFLGWIHFPHHRILRTTTKRRILSKFNTSLSKQSISSYSGVIRHGNTHKISLALAKKLITK